MKISSDVFIVVGALGVAAFLAAQDSRQEWTLSGSNNPGMVRFKITRIRPGQRATTSSDFPIADFQGLKMDSGPARFEYVQDAGSFVCEGRFFLGRGSGTYKVVPNPKYVTALRELGYDTPTEEQTFYMLLNGVSLEFARSIRDAGIRANTGQLLELRSQGVNTNYIRDLAAAGYPRLTSSELIELKQQGVDAGFLRELHEAGYDIPIARVIELKQQGVSPRYIRALDAYGLKPDPRDIVRFKQEGIEPEYLRGVRSAGYANLRPDQIVNLKQQGVEPDYLRGLHDAGYVSLDAGQIVEMKNQGVSPEFLRDAHELGYAFSTSEAIDLKHQGVDGPYLRKLKDSGLRTLTAEQIVKLKIHGVD